VLHIPSPPSYFPCTNGYFPLNKAARLFVGAGSQGGSGNNLCPRITWGMREQTMNTKNNKEILLLHYTDILQRINGNENHLFGIANSFWTKS
jgi:hypothetical protein